MTYRNDTGLPSVTEVISPWIDKQWFTDECRLRGSAVHNSCAAYVHGLYAPKLQPEWQPYFDSAKRWIDNNVAEAVIVEKRLIDTTRGYCGKLDLLAKLKDGTLTLIDWKTSQATSKWWGLQDAGYWNLVKVSNGVEPDRGLTIRLKKNGSGALVTEHTQRAYHLNIFFSALNAYKFFN